MRSLLAAAVLVSLPSAGFGAVLYSGAGMPSDQGAAYVPIGAAVQAGAVPGVTVDTTGSAGIYAGYFYQLPAGTLDKSAGFDLSITVAVLSAPVMTGTRSGLSFLALTSDHTGIELAVQPGLIFAQAAGFGSPTGESVAFDATGLTTYDVAVSGTGYVLKANGVAILSGALRDYSGTPTPFGPVYSSTDLVFIGDDTSSASGKFQFTAAAVVAPEGSAMVPVVMAGGAVLRRRR